MEVQAPDPAGAGGRDPYVQGSLYGPCHPWSTTASLSTAPGVYVTDSPLPSLLPWPFLFPEVLLPSVQHSFSLEIGSALRSNW